LEPGIFAGFRGVAGEAGPVPSFEDCIAALSPCLALKLGPGGDPRRFALARQAVPGEFWRIQLRPLASAHRMHPEEFAKQRQAGRLVAGSL